LGVGRRLYCESALTNAVGLGERAAKIGAQGESITDYEHRLGLDRGPRKSVPAGPEYIPEKESQSPEVGIKAGLPPTRPEGIGKAAPAARGGRGSRARSGAAEHDDFKSYLDSLEKSIALLDAEAGALGKSNGEKERAVDLARAEEIAKERGRPLTQQEIEQVTALADRHAQLRARIDETREAQRAANEQSRFFAETAFSAIDRLTSGAAKLTDVLQSVVKTLAQAALKAALLGEGPLASLVGGKGGGGLGGIFGFLASLIPGHAAGGVIPPGGVGLVGERGPELAFGGAAGLNIVPNAATMSLLRAPSNVSNSRVANNSISVNIHTPNAQSFARSEGQIAAMLARAVALAQRGL
jgi:hypothetical protein